MALIGGCWLAAYLQDEPARLEILGDDAVVNEHAATPLALFIHEMATNSARFGALSVPAGRLRLSIAMDANLTMDWQENGGPMIQAPPKPAFGIGLAQLCIERQLNGTLKIDWQPDGLHVEARIAVRLRCRLGRPVPPSRHRRRTGTARWIKPPSALSHALERFCTARR
jgi:two-component sensor histidine kinase